MDTVSLKIRQFQEPQDDKTNWKTLATFHSNMSTTEKRTQNEIEADSGTVTVYLLGESYELVQFGWFFSHLKQNTLSTEEQETKLSRVNASISDISVTILNNRGFELK